MNPIQVITQIVLIFILLVIVYGQGYRRGHDAAQSDNSTEEDTDIVKRINAQLLYK